MANKGKEEVEKCRSNTEDLQKEMHRKIAKEEWSVLEKGEEAAEMEQGEEEGRDGEHRWMYVLLKQS